MVVDRDNTDHNNNDQDKQYDATPIWRMVKHIVIGMIALYALFALAAFVVSLFSA